MTERDDTADLAARHARTIIRDHLGRCSAMRHARLAEATGIDEATLKIAVEHLVQSGEVEVIRPLADSCDHLPESLARERTYYRLLRETDNDFLWERFLSIRMPVTRLADVRASENRRTHVFPRVAEEVWG